MTKKQERQNQLKEIFKVYNGSACIYNSPKTSTKSVSKICSSGSTIAKGTREKFKGKLNKKYRIPIEIINKHNRLIRVLEAAKGTIEHLNTAVMEYQNFIIEHKLDDKFREWWHKKQEISE